MKNGFLMPELILESLIRDGLQNLKDDPKIIDDVFAQLTRNYNNRKYGQAEITKIKAMVQKEVSVVYTYSQVDSRVPCISIMVGSDTESKARDHIGDYYDGETEQITDTDELQTLHRVDDLQAVSYNPLTGQIQIDNGSDLSEVYKGMIFVDAEGNEFDLLAGINNLTDQKMITIQKQAEVSLSGPVEMHIKSSLDYRQFEVKGVTADVSLVLGVHTKDVLSTKYLYILLKYIVLSRKFDMIKRGLYLATYSGSDFNRDSEYVADMVYTRFLTVTGKVDDTWRSDQVILIDNVEVDPIPVDDE